MTTPAGFSERNRILLRIANRVPRSIDAAWIESPRGKCKQKVELFDGIDERVIHIEHGWWYPEQEGPEPHLYGAFESNANCLTSVEPTFLDIGFGGYTLRGFLAKVYKANR